MIKFNVEIVDPRSIVGWAYDDAAQDKPVTVRVALQEGSKSTEAVIYHKHLETAGIRDGAAGFVIRLEAGEMLDLTMPVLFESHGARATYDFPAAVRRSLRYERETPLFLNHSPPLLRCVLVLIIRNEARYVAEWIEYHRLLGVDHFLVFDNQSTDDLSEALAPYVRLGIATIISWPDIPASEASKKAGWIEQNTAYSNAMRLLARKAQWAGLIDIDEFVVFEGGAVRDLPAFLDSLDTPIVSLYWRPFGTSGIRKRPDGLVIENFVRRGPDPPPEDTRRLMKVFVRPEQVHSVINAHQLVVGQGRLTGMTTDGTPSRGVSRLAPTFKRAFLHHYHTRSEEEYMEKVRRGWPKNTQEKNFDWRGHFELHDSNQLSDDSLVPLAGRILEGIERARHAQPLRPVKTNWLLHVPDTLLLSLTADRRENKRIELQGFVVDLAQPLRRFALSFHDGHGRVYGVTECTVVHHTLKMYQIGDGAYGFETSFECDRSWLFASCESFVASVEITE